LVSTTVTGSAGVAEPQAASTRLKATTTKTRGRTDLVISIFSFSVFMLTSYQPVFNGKGRMG